MLPTPHLCLEVVVFSPMLRALEELVVRIQLLQIEEHLTTLLRGSGIIFSYNTKSQCTSFSFRDASTTVKIIVHGTFDPSDCF